VRNVYTAIRNQLTPVESIRKILSVIETYVLKELWRALVVRSVHTMLNVVHKKSNIVRHTDRFQGSARIEME